MGMFEKASRLKVRWNIRGNNMAEDLWTLPLRDLDDHYDQLCTLKEGQKKNSLLVDRKAEDEVLELKIEIIKHVVTTRLEEKKKWDESRANAEYRQKLAGIIENKKDDALLAKSIDELEKLLKETE